MKLYRRKRNGQKADFRYGRPLDDGTYTAQVLHAEESVSRQGNEMLVLTFGIEGPEGGVKVDHYTVTYLSDRVEELLAALAPERLEAWRADESCDLDPAELVRRRCLVEVASEPWHGKDRPRIRALAGLATLAGSNGNGSAG